MIACLSVPYFAAAVERRTDPTLQQRPLAIGGRSWEAKPAYAFSEELANQGVKSGMSLRAVQVLSPHSHFLPATKPHYSQVSAELTDILTDFTPAIEPQELWHAFAESEWRLTAHGRSLPVRYCLDLDGLSHSQAILFVQEMGKRVRQETSFAPTIGLAADKFTAQVAAVVSRPNHLMPIAADDTPQFLSRRPISFLPLDKETARRLHLLGIRTLGQFIEIPLHSLREQFGRAIEPLYRMAKGQADEPLQPEAAEQRETIERHFSEPLTNIQVLSAVLAQMVDELSKRLQTAALAGRTLQLNLETEDGLCQQQTFNLSRPTADVRRITTTLQEYMTTITFGSGIMRIVISLTGLVPAAARQLSLFGETAASSTIQQAVENLTTKYHTSRFIQPILTDNHHPLPERRFQLQTMTYDPALA